MPRAKPMPRKMKNGSKNKTIVTSFGLEATPYERRASSAGPDEAEPHRLPRGQALEAGSADGRQLLQPGPANGTRPGSCPRWATDGTHWRPRFGVGREDALIANGAAGAGRGSIAA